MATSATWTATLTLAGDDTATKLYNAAANNASPASDTLINLASGANTLTSPVAAVPTRLTIIPPALNTVLLTLKGITGDTGVHLHLTDPTSIAIDSTLVSVVLNAAAICNGVRVLWT